MVFASDQDRSNPLTGEPPNHPACTSSFDPTAPNCDEARSKLSLDEIAFFGHVLTRATRQWRAAARALRDHYSLGPRGPWILDLVAKGKVVKPSDLTDSLQCGRSQITSELIKLTAAGLVMCHKSDLDRRHLELSLTPLGDIANWRLADTLVRMFENRLAGHAREGVLFCARILHDLAGSARNVK